MTQKKMEGNTSLNLMKIPSDCEDEKWVELTQDVSKSGIWYWR
jgi:hypothetical protein